MGINEIIVLVCVGISIFLWATELIDKMYVSIALIAVFMLLTDVSMKRVFAFPISSNFMTIISSFLIAQGVVKSGAAKAAAGNVLHRFCSSQVSLLISGAMLNLVLAFAIPQPVPRITLLGTVYYTLLSGQDLTKEQKKAILFSVFVTATSTSMVILNGDIILNNAALSIGGISMGQAEWLKYMTVPTVAATCTLVLLFYLCHRKSFAASIKIKAGKEESIGRDGKIASIIVLGIIILWMTEGIHGLPQSFVSISGVVMMFFFKILRKEDIKYVNVSLLVFLTAEFALGNVLVDTGIASAISQALKRFIPDSDTTIGVLLPLMIVVIVIHTLFGGAMSSMSVTIPIAMTIWGNTVSNTEISLIVLFLVTCQYVFPYNQLTILVGYGQDYYGFRDVMKFSVPLTLWSALTLILIYVPWWHITGLM